ncbi:MAG: hypothetical protein E4H32_02380 [Nitrospirales bacterium]|nr:MAG: hypothetical protein E4H32_02380 [Nitrospirales bacterium]
MSKLIDALNRLQTLKDEAPLAIANPPGEVPPSVLPFSPNSGTRSSAVPKKTAGRKPQNPEAPLFNMAAKDWLGVVQQEYLKNFVRDGGGAIKVAVFPDQDSLQGCQHSLDGMAKAEGYVFAKVDARYTKVHLVERLFHKIAKQVDWDNLAYRFVLRLLEEHGYQIPANRNEFSLRQVAALNERKEPMLRRDVQTWLEKSIDGDSGLCREFRMAMIRLCLAQFDSGDSDRVLATAVK